MPKKDYLDDSCESLIQEASYTLEREQSYSLELSLEHFKDLNVWLMDIVEAQAVSESTNSDFYEVKTRTDSNLMVSKGYWIIGHDLDICDPIG